MKLLTNNNYASPQGGGTMAAIKTIEIQLDAADVAVNSEYNLGPAPEKGLQEKLWRFSHCTMVRPSNDGLDTGTGIRFDLGTEDDQDYFAFVNNVTGVAVDLEPTLIAHSNPFPDTDLILKVRTAPTTAADGVLRIILWGYAA